MDATVAKLTSAGFEVRDTERLRAEGKSVCKQWLRSVVNHIDSQFPRIDLLVALSTLFDPAHLPAATDPAFTDYGKEALFVLGDFYCPTTATPPPDGKLIERADEKAAATRARANFEARLKKGDFIKGSALQLEWQLFKPRLAKWRDKFDEKQQALMREKEIEMAKGSAKSAKAADKEAKAKSERERAEKEKKAKEKADRENAEREKAEREKAAKEKVDEEKKKDKGGKRSRKRQKTEPKSNAKGGKEEKEQSQAKDVKEAKDKSSEDKEKKGEQRDKQPDKARKGPRLRMADVVKMFLASEDLPDCFPNLAKLAAVAVVVPMSSVECERVFSCLNRYLHCYFVTSSCYVRFRVKTIARNRMKGDLLNWLIMISLHAPSDLSKFNYEAVVQYWSTRWRHRLEFRSSNSTPQPAETDKDDDARSPFRDG